MRRKRVRLPLPLRLVCRTGHRAIGRGALHGAEEVPQRANRRNLLRRRTKEAYRLQKQIVRNGATVNLDLALIYSSKEVLPYKVIANAVRKILEHVAERL